SMQRSIGRARPFDCWCRRHSDNRALPKYGKINRRDIILVLQKGMAGMEAASHSEPVGFILEQAGFPADNMTVAVVITTFNQARFLGEALMSVLAQTRQADRIIVVDDGSSDDPASV